MPKIREYENPIRGLDVNGAGASAIARGAEFAGQTMARERIAPALNRLGDAVADRYEQFVVQPELSKGAALFAQYQADLTKKWNTLAKNTDPNDQTINTKFNEGELEPALDKFIGGFNTGEGKKWAEAQAANFRNHMVTKTAADMSSRAGAAAANNLDVFKNAQTTRVMNDPSSFEDAIKTVDETVANVVRNPLLDAKTATAIDTKLRQDLKSELAKAYIMGVAQRNPAEAERIVQSGKLDGYVNAMEAKSLLNYSRVQQRAERQDQELQRVQAARARAELSNSTSDKYMQRLFPEKGPTDVTTTQIVNDPNLDQADKRYLVALVNRELKPETETRLSRHNTNELFTRIQLPEGDPNKITDLTPITQAMIDGKLTRADFEFLRKEVKEIQTPEGLRFSERKAEFFNGVKSLIDTSVIGGALDATGKQKLYEYRVFVESKIEEYRKAGKNPYDLFDPSKPEYLGKADAIAPYQRDLRQQIKDKNQRLFNTKVAPPISGQVKQDQDRLIPVAPIPAEILKEHPDAKRDINGKIVVQRTIDSKKQWFTIREPQ